MRSQQKRDWIYTSIASSVCVLVGLICHVSLDQSHAERQQEKHRNQAEIRAACLQHVGLACGKVAGIIDSRSREFGDFIKSRKPGGIAFAKEMVSFQAKLLVLNDQLPFTAKNQHERFVKTNFEQHFFSSDELEDAMKRAIQGAAKDVEAIENNLAVELRQEVLGKPLSSSEAVAASKEFDQMIHEMVKASQWDAAKTMGNIVASEIASSVAPAVLTELGVSTGILATGAASSEITLGIGLAVGVAVDIAWGWIDDPRGKIEKGMNRSLDELALRGDTAIKAHLDSVLSARQQFWMDSARKIKL